MATQIKITQLTNIGSANTTVTTLLPVVNMAGTPTTQKTTLGNLANVILSQSGGNYAPANLANIAYSVANAAQPNITSVGTLTNLAVSGNATVNGNITSNGTAYVGNLSTTGLASITTLSVGATANLGAVGNVKITGGTDGYVLQTDGTGNLSWTAQTGGGGNGAVGGANTQVQFNDAGAFAGNSGFTFNKTTGILAAPFADVSGVANIVGGGATVATKSLLNVASTFGSNSASDPASAQAIRGRVTGSNLAQTRNYVTGVTGQYLVTGTNASEFIKAGVLGVVGDQTTTADGAVVAYLDGDGGLTTANAAYAVSMKNSTPNSGFNYGLDLQFIDLNLGGVTTSTFKQADIRFNNGVKLVANTAGNISINGNLMTSAEVVASGVIQSGTGLTTGGYLSVDGNTDLHDTTVTGNLSATGNITANNLGNIVSVNLTGSNANVLYGNGVFAPVSGGAGGLPLANGNSNFNIATANGNATVTTAGTQTWTFDTTGNLTIPGTITSGNTITIDNRASGNGADINLYSADDILIQARDRDIGSTSEGGDINIFAGDSAEDSDTSAGDIVIEAGRGGASNLDFGGDGGFVRVEAGQGGAAVGANISARSGGSLTLNAGDAGGNNGNIDLGNSGGDVTINAGDSTGNGDPGGSIILRSGDAGANALAGQIQLIISSSDEGSGGTWTFDGAGIIQLPNSGTNIDIGSTSAISLEASSAVNIYTDTGTNAWQWQFQDDGNLRLPTIELDVGNTINEQTVIQSQRKIIPGLRYSAEINGTTPTVVYTATSVDTTSMKVTMQIQHIGLGFEFFDVSATSTGGDTFYTVSNRVQPPTIDNSTVVVDLNGSNIMEITVTINSGAANSWVTYDATEFGIAVD